MNPRLLPILALVTLLPACSPEVKTHGPRQDVTATYHNAALSTSLAPTARVPAVIAAADQTLRARGYAVQRSTATEEAGELIANAPRYNNYPRVRVRATRADAATLLEVKVEPFGDQELSRSVLDGILQKLGQ
ncbi:MAG TPA: hypothetical protein VD997_09370 [Phycisphaerales bacterium]|nr:hypothetical protein [Phycisphaerales bacterium]